MDTRLQEFLFEYGYTDEFLDENVRVYHDLQIYGDDAVEFLDAFEKEFNIDLSQFNITEYFPNEGGDVFVNIFRLLVGKPEVAYKELTLYDLCRAIEVGYLK